MKNAGYYRMKSGRDFAGRMKFQKSKWIVGAKSAQGTAGQNTRPKDNFHHIKMQVIYPPISSQGKARGERCSLYIYKR